MEHPPWKYKDTNPDYYHRGEFKALRNMRMEIEELAYRLKFLKDHYDLSAVLIPESLELQLASVSDDIYEEIKTRDGSGKPSEWSFIALKAKKAQEPKCPNCEEHNGPLEFKTDLGQGDEMVCEECYNDLEEEEVESDCEFCGEPDEDDHECIPERREMDKPSNCS